MFLRSSPIRPFRASVLAAASAAVAFVLVPAAAHAGGQPPVHLVFDMHSDPLPQAPYFEKADWYAMQLDDGNWVLDRTEPLGVRISFLGSGEFMEFVVQGGPDGTGADFLRRIYAAGEQIGSHSHSGGAGRRRPRCDVFATPIRGGARAYSRSASYRTAVILRVRSRSPARSR